MANPKHLTHLQKGVDHWNGWRLKTLSLKEYEHPDLSGENFFGKDLSDFDLSNTDLSRCDLRSAKLGGVDFRGALLDNARFAGSTLINAKFGSLAYFWNKGEITVFPPKGKARSKADGPNFSDAWFGYTTIDQLDLRRWQGLQTAKHLGASILTPATLVESQGSIPIPFLRGCGLSDSFIEYLPSLLNQAIEFYSCFISYSTKDQAFADRLHADLQNKGVRCWFAPHDVQGGKKLHEQVDQAIQVHERLLLILSKASMESEWVKTEIAKARKREVRENRRMLFPVRLIEFDGLKEWECFDADTGKDSAREIREYYVPDFSNWKDHGSYQKEFGKLLKDLKTDYHPKDLVQL